MNTSVLDKILQQLNTLPSDKQKRVLDFTRSLSHDQGTSGKALLDFAGAFPEKEILTINREIEEGCEKNDGGEW